MNTRTGPGTEYEKANKFAQYGDKLYILKDTVGWVEYSLNENSDWSGWVKKSILFQLMNGKKKNRKKPPNLKHNMK